MLAIMISRLPNINLIIISTLSILASNLLLPASSIPLNNVNLALNADQNQNRTLLFPYEPQTRSPGLSLEQRTVWNPHITNPQRGARWTRGANVDVTWETASKPQGASDRGMLLLGYQEHPGGSEHLDFEHPLKKDVDLSQGRVTITVPQVPRRHNYIVVLMGDSGNKSPPFSIQ